MTGRTGRATIDPARSRVWFRGRSTVHPIEIRAERPEGWVRFDESDDEAPVGSLVITVASLRTGQVVQEIELRRQLRARRHPTIDAAVRSVHRRSDGRFDVEGDITFLGTTRPAAGTVAVEHDGRGLRITGDATFDVRDFGFVPPRVLGLRVEPEVAVAVELVATLDADPAR